VLILHFLMYRNCCWFRQVRRSRYVWSHPHCAGVLFQLSHARLLCARFQLHYTITIILMIMILFYNTPNSCFLKIIFYTTIRAEYFLCYCPFHRTDIINRISVTYLKRHLLKTVRNWENSYMPLFFGTEFVLELKPSHSDHTGSVGVQR